MIVVIGSPCYLPPEGTTPDEVGGLAAAIARSAAAEGATVQFVGKVGDDATGDALVLALGRAGIGHAAILRDAGHPTPILAAPSTGDDDSMTDGRPGVPLIETMLGDDAAIDRDTGIDKDTGIDPDATADPVVDVVLPEDPARRPRLDPADLELALRYLTEFSVVVVGELLDEAAAQVVSQGASYAGAQVVAIVPVGGEAPPAFTSATLLESPLSDPDGAFARLVGQYAAALDAGTAPADAFRSVVARDGWELAAT